METDAVTMSAVSCLQKCVRDTTACVTRFINAFDDARGRRYDDTKVAERHDRAMRLWRRAGDDCTTVADRALPPLIEAVRATIVRPTSVNAVFELINAASEAVRVNKTQFNFTRC